MKKKFNYLYHVYNRKKNLKKNRSVNVMVADGVAPYVARPSAPMFDYVR